MSQKITSYPLAIMLNTISTVAMVGGLIWLVYGYMKNLPEELQIVVFILSFAQWVFLKKPLSYMLQKAILDNEYDEFGVSKKKKFENLSRAERERIDLQKAAQMESLLPSSVIQKITQKGSLNPEKDLDALIGLLPVKNKINEMIMRAKFERESIKKNGKQKSANSFSGRHMVFYGSPGTGKTTVARIMTGLLYKYGYIKQNKCLEIDGNFLKAGEDSAAKTRMIVRKAYGGVLFIDEAYAIIEGSGGYGKEAVATLVKEMEDNRDKFIVILAGYRHDMKRLLDSNEGLKSRIKEYFNFPDYTVEEMKQIFVRMANTENFVVSEEALVNFEIRCQKEKNLASFGNGRTVRNILDETLDRHALNYEKGKLTRSIVGKDGKETVVGNEENKFILCGCDVSTTVNKSIL
jgi:stage V sporulation protein K